MINPPQHPPRHGSMFRRGFTLIELMVSVAILVVVILSVGIIFQSATRAVGVSQSVLGMLSNVRAVETQMNHDVGGLDKNSFLVIRSRIDATGRRFDQVSFISYGDFPNRTGANASSAPFTDPLVTSSALVWYGQLAIQKPTPPATGNYLTSAQGTAVPLAQVPSGVNDSDFVLGRSATLLVGQGSNSPPTYTYGTFNYRAFASPAYTTPTVSGFTSNESASHISCSRIDLAFGTPGTIMQSIMDVVALSPRPNTYEADTYCYRHAALLSPYDSETGATTGSVPLIYNGIFRMSPVMLQGISSFAVDWSDGTPDVTNGLKWYGLTDAAYAVLPKADVTIEPAAPSNSDNYQAIFSFDNRAKWPTALRFRMHVADSTGRLPTGRDFVQVINLP